MGYSFKILALLVLSNILSISTATQAIEPDCGSCSKPPIIPVVPLLPPINVPKVPVVGVVPLPPVTLPPVTPVVPLPPVTIPKVPIIGVVPLPPVTVPPVTIPPVVGVLPLPPVTVPPVTIPPVVGVVPLPPVTLPLPLPPVVIITPKPTKPCAPVAHKKVTCPLNTLKLGSCASVLGAKVSIGLGDPTGHKCCSIISGLADAEAAACLCTTLKINALNIKIYVPVALQLLITCGKTPPPGYTCPV